MTTFFGFGLRLSIKGVEETVKEESNQKKKSALRLQVGFQMPKIYKSLTTSKTLQSQLGFRDFAIIV